MQTIRQQSNLKSPLVRQARHQLRKERNHEASAKIFAVCLFVVVAYLVAAFVQQYLEISGAFK